MTDSIEATAPKLAVEIDRNTVTIIVECQDRYAAIELYKNVCAGGRDGHIELKIETRDGSLLS